MTSLALMAALVLAQPWNPDDKEGRFARFTSRTDQGRSDRGFDANGLAFFEFAPASGAGMGAACACAAVTGARGEALTFTRASTATCTKGNTTTGIANGDLVTCAINAPRVMPGGDGTGGVGLLVESSRTNVILQSQAIDNAAFADFVGTGGAAPTLNAANGATAPDGTLTAERYTFAATTGLQASARAQVALTAAAYSCTVFVQGQAGTGTTDVCIQTGAGPTATCAACAFVSGSWSQCNVSAVTSIASGTFYIGNNSALNGGTARSSNAVNVWGAQCEAGTYATSYIPTTTVAVTRAAEGSGATPALALASSLAAGSGFSSAQTTVLEGFTATTGLGVSVGQDATNRQQSYGTTANAYSCSYISTGGSGTATQAGSSFPIGVGFRTACSFGGTASPTVTAFYGGASSSVSATGATPFASTSAYISNLPPTLAAPIDGIIKQVCLDPSPTRCR